MKVKEHYLDRFPISSSTEDFEYEELVMKQIMHDCTIANYVILNNGQHCYLAQECDPERNICFCST